MKTGIKEIAILIFAMVFTETAIAYVGPGAGLTLIGSLIGLIIAVITALAIILFWPIRALIRKMRGKNAVQDTVAEQTEEK